ncbi:ORF28 [Eptesicus fuscus gammaherpesvirus]|uniref:ORF28 n=1 Tax=vespertilionid gammaherpesvirus 3 TaxID=2846598 RepID=A0A2D0ZNW1_9GAMA|nr:ORF28 [Eptesicus fuscus gammaherpesvirus]ATA58257.1 ORF28 [Eptesicus fuscus gammaherpesvirus]WAH70928.1 ORF28 [Eptesicus fuscus gammaherpesvirus]
MLCAIPCFATISVLFIGCLVANAMFMHYSYTSLFLEDTPLIGHASNSTREPASSTKTAFVFLVRAMALCLTFMLLFALFFYCLREMIECLVRCVKRRRSPKRWRRISEDEDTGSMLLDSTNLENPKKQHDSEPVI